MVSCLITLILAKASFTTPDPITEERGSATGACGGIYLPNSSWVAINNCDFDFGSGVACYAPGIANSMNTFNLNWLPSGHRTTHNNRLIGGSVILAMVKLWVAAMELFLARVSGQMDNMDIERCQVGIRHTNPYPYWDRNTHTIFSARLPLGIY